MDLIDEVIGAARANAAQAKDPHERETWEVHMRNCERVKREMAMLHDQAMRAYDVGWDHGAECEAKRIRAAVSPQHITPGLDAATLGRQARP